MKCSAMLLLSLLLLLSFLDNANAITIINDPVEPGQGWSGTSAFNGGFGMTDPIEGSNVALFASQSALV